MAITPLRWAEDGARARAYKLLASLGKESKTNSGLKLAIDYWLPGASSQLASERYYTTT